VPVGKRADADRRLRQSVRFARIMRLLEHLLSRFSHDTGSLARELEVCRRTIQRDIEVLRLAGVPVDYDSAEHRYVLGNDYRFAIAGLTDEEVLGQATASVLSSARGLDIGVGAAPATRKIRGTSRGRTGEILADALRVTAVLDLKLADHEGHREIIQTAQQALLEQVVLEGRYTSPYQKSEQVVRLHPIRLCLIKQAWYLIARPEDSDHVVTYRMARFRSLFKLQERTEVPQEFDLRAYFGNAWAVYRGKPTYEVELRFAAEAAVVVSETTWHPTQQSQKHDDGSLTLRFRVDGLEEIVWWVLGWSGTVKVIQPPELRHLVAEKLRRALELNG
jgi:predicted DNA-binding transcriptional regulator YafY